MTDVHRMLVGVSGATGIVYGVRLLELLRGAGIETHLVVTKPAGMTRAYETDLSAEQMRHRGGTGGRPRPTSLEMGHLSGFD